MDLNIKTKNMLKDLASLPETKDFTDEMLIEVCVGIIHDKQYHEPDLL